MEQQDKIKGILEAILFTMGESVPINRLAEVMEMEAEELRQILIQMKEDYQQDSRGITLIELEDAWQICTKIETY